MYFPFPWFGHKVSLRAYTSLRKLCNSLQFSHVAVFLILEAKPRSDFDGAPFVALLAADALLEPDVAVATVAEVVHLLPAF